MEVFPTAEESISLVDLKRLVRELSSASFEHVLPSSDRRIYIPKLGPRICTINQLTRSQRASLTKDQLFQVLSFMVNFPSALESTLAHRRGRHQPVEEDESSTDHSEAGPSRAEQDIGSEACNAPADPSRQVQPVRGGRVKARAQRGCARGCRAQEEGEDPVDEGEDHAQPLLQFKVDRHPSKMTKQELDVIRELYYVPDRSAYPASSCLYSHL